MSKKLGHSRLVDAKQILVYAHSGRELASLVVAGGPDFATVMKPSIMR